MAHEFQDSLPQTVHEAIEGMALWLNPDVAGDLQATIQFSVSSSTSLETDGNDYLSIADGKCDFSVGTTNDPTLTLFTPADIWLKVARKEMSGAIAPRILYVPLPQHQLPYGFPNCKGVRT